MLNRKIRKLLRDPKLFINDFKKNRITKLNNSMQPKEVGYFTYSVVSAVYNSEKYLDDFFKSFIRQSLKFKNNIHLIMVDDGSTDNSKIKIQQWVEKFPKNIHYFYKENGGQSSARNLGLTKVKTDWVTFIDSDDFVDENYFLNIDNLAQKKNNLKLICCNQIYYIEETKKAEDRHPLNYRFKNGLSIVTSDDLGKNIQFSAPLSFFKMENIDHELKFDETLKPTFEDGKFVAHYILGLNNNEVAFFDKPKYFNRKREDKSSTMDNAWLNKGQFGVVLENGYIPTLNNYQKKLGSVPRFMQRTILWEMLRLVKHIVNQEENLSFLNNDEKSNFLKLMDETFEYIEKETILSFELGSCGFSRQVGMLGCFKQSEPDIQVAYLEKDDKDQNLMLVRYFHSSADDDIDLKINGINIVPHYEKHSHRYFLDRIFLIESRFWIPISNGELSISINSKPVNINYIGKRYKNRVAIKKQKNIKRSKQWLLMDRDDSAGDNAEHLYDSIMKNNPHKIIPTFILSKKSLDWERLKKKNFNLVEFGSDLHKKHLIDCDYVVSSHIGNILNPFNIKCDHKKIFLQHGVTKDDISKWINNCHFDLMLTASEDEHKSIINDGNRYIYGKKEIKLTGFPRFDSLKNNDYIDKTILIMPTWRKNLSGQFENNNSSKRVYNKNFKNSTYFQEIQKLIESKVFEDITSKNLARVIFCPHPNTKDYIKDFSIPGHIELPSNSDTFNTLILKSSLLITDYSSIAFDFAYSKKPVIYYQFDEIDFFNGGHTYSRGYFNYHENGFGPVINDIDSLSNEVRESQKNSFLVSEKYQKRISETFPTIDSNNCDRVISAILSLENEDKLTEDQFTKYISDSSTKNKWDRIVDAYEQYLLPSRTLTSGEKILYANALIHTGKVTRSIDLIDSINDCNAYERSEINKLHSLIYMIHFNWDKAVCFWRKSNSLTPSEVLLFLLALAFSKQKEEFNELQHRVLTKVTRAESELLSILHNFSIGDLSLAKAQTELLLNDTNRKSNASPLFKLDIIMSYFNFISDDFDGSHISLKNYEMHSKSDGIHRLMIILLAFKRNEHEKVIKQFESLDRDFKKLPTSIIKLYLKSLMITRTFVKAREVINSLDEDVLLDDDFSIILADLEWIESRSIDSLKSWEMLSARHPSLNKKLASAYRTLGEIEKSYYYFIQYEKNMSLDHEDLIFKSEICQLLNKWTEASSSIKDLIRYHSELVDSNTWKRLSHFQMMESLRK